MELSKFDYNLILIYIVYSDEIIQNKSNNPNHNQVTEISNLKA